MNLLADAFCGASIGYRATLPDRARRRGTAAERPHLRSAVPRRHNGSRMSRCGGHDAEEQKRFLRERFEPGVRAAPCQTPENSPNSAGGPPPSA